MSSQTQQPQTSPTHRSPTQASQGSGQPHPLRGPVSSPERFTPATRSSNSSTSEPQTAVSRIDLKAISASLLIELSECQTREAARSSLIRFICHLLNPTSVHLWRVIESGQIAVVDAPEVTLPPEEMVKHCQQGRPDGSSKSARACHSQHLRLRIPPANVRRVQAGEGC